MAIYIEDFDRIEELVVIAFEVESVLDFLPPEGPGFLAIGHPRFDGRRRDAIDAAEVVWAREPGVDDVGCADVFEADGAIGLPGLLEGLPDALGRAAIPAIHGAALDHDVVDASAAHFLHVLPGHIGGILVRRPGGRSVVGRRPKKQDGAGGRGCHSQQASERRVEAPSMRCESWQTFVTVKLMVLGALLIGTVLRFCNRELVPRERTAGEWSS